MKLIMRNCKFLFAVVLSAVLFTGCASSSKNKPEENTTPLVWAQEVKQGKLENGMSYLIRHNEEPKNRIELRLIVKAGSCMEEDDQKGVAHFVEHLAFNGTENFEKSAIVDYFEKIGMNFGADLNAYTSFEETVYKLQVPADDPEMLKTALLILHDWASAITFPQEEIDKERGVVTEEWRLRQGLQGRISDKQIPFFLADSRFEERLPIGDMDVIKNISRDRILDFYNKWYKPEIMSVVVVGDSDVNTLETAIKEAMEVIPKSEKPISSPEFQVPVATEKEICIFKDTEQKYTVMNIISQIPDYKIRETEEDLKQNVVDAIGSKIFNQRMNEITNTADSPWLDAGAGLTAYTRTTYFNYLGVVPKTGIFTEAVKAFFDECDRIFTFGVTESEVSRLKDYYLSVAEQEYNNRDKIDSDTIASELIDYVTKGKIPVSEEDVYNVYKKVIPEITVEEVNQTIVKAFGNRGTKMMIIAPDSADDIPTEKDLLEIWKNHKNSEIAAYEDDVDGDELMNRPANKGVLVSQKEIPELGAKEFIFKNGIRVLTKKTDFEVNTINMVVSGKGGLYLVDDVDIPSARSSVNYAILSGVNGMNYNQLIKKITAKQIGLGINIRNTEENFTGSCKTEDFESMLQLVNLFFTKAQFTADAWQTVSQNNIEQAKNYGVQPNDLFYSKIREILFNDIRNAPFDLDYVSKMNPEAAERIYRERFGNPADFTYVFVGDFDEASLIENCAYYLGTMPTSAEREETKYIYYDFPKGIISETVKKGLDEQGKVFITLGGKLTAASDVEETYKDMKMMSELESLLDIRLREVIREDKSGSYGIGVNAYVDGYPERYYRVEISFGCEPSRAEELTAEVIRQLEILKKEPVSADYIEKLRETYRRSRETSERDNEWWLNRLNAELVFNYEPLWITHDVETVQSWITAENLQALANKYFNTKNYVSVFLKPEK